jgi:hypothetical protein
VSRNGRALPGSAGDPAKIVRETLWIVAIVAVLQICYAALAVSYTPRDAVAITMIGVGVILLLLIILASRRSLAAMTLATTVCFVEVVIFFGALAQWSIARALPLFFALYLVGWLLWRGVTAMRDPSADRLPIRRA